MIRKFNYTGRKKIPQSCIDLEIQKNDYGQIEIIADVDVSNLNLPKYAKVYIEAFDVGFYQRFDFGNVEETFFPTNNILSELQDAESVSFKCLVVDESGDNFTGNLLAKSTKITKYLSNEDKQNHKTILHIVYKDNIDCIWRIDFENIESGGYPVVELNSRLSSFDLKNKLINNSEYKAIFFPPLLREILNEIAKANTDEDGEGWQANWLTFIIATLGIENNPTKSDEKDEATYNEEVSAWINRCVDAFVLNNKLLDEFINKLDEGDSNE